MVLSDLTTLTIMFEFVPPLVVTLIYLLFFGNRKSKFIEAFIILMYLKTVTYFLMNMVLLPVSVGSGFDPFVDTRTLSWLLLTDLLFHFVTSLQEYMMWVMVSFFAVMFGMVVLAAKLALQDPLKMRFKNLIRSITKREPESDGYTGFSDRLANIRFEGLEPQPLNPEVQDRAWRDAWRDYLIIGLATLIPSIPIYIGGVTAFVNGYSPDVYLWNIMIFLTWIYRFGYPASNRIAKGAGLRLGNRDVGGEMMRGVLGWFFRLNLVLSFGLVGFQVYQAFTTGVAVSEILNVLFAYYTAGLIYGVPPIIFAILLLPLVEDFAVVLYKKAFDSITQARTKVSKMNMGGVIRNLSLSIGTGLAATAAFTGSVFAITSNYAIERRLFLFFPREIDDEFVAGVLINPVSNLGMMGETIWLLMLLAIPFAMIIVLGIIGHFVWKRSKGGIESFALFSGLTLSMVTYYVFPGLDYIVNFSLTPAYYAGEVFNRFRPVLSFPQPEQQWVRLASQFIINMPLFIFSTLFILYFFKYRESWRNQVGETAGPLLHVHQRDIFQSAVMFFGGLVLSIIGAWGLSVLIADPGLVYNLLTGLFNQISRPEGLEAVLVPFNLDNMIPRWDPAADPFGWFIIFAEHNMVRILLMLVLGPMFWSAALWLTGVEKTDSEKSIGTWSIVTLIIGGVLTYVWTVHDARIGLFNPYNLRWGVAAQLGLRALVVFGALFLIVGLIAIIRSRGGKGIGAWWFPLFIFIFAAEYFIYDDQFTIIALVVLPIILAAGYKLTGRGRGEDFLISYIKFSIMSLAISEVLSTALTLGGIAIIELQFIGISPLELLARIIPHAIVEIPTFLVAAGAAIRISKDLWPIIESEEWESVPSKTRALLGDARTWRTYALIVFFLVIAALIEAFITPIVYWMVVL
ncbi:MAG: stage II sporulation protein M [Candidatus Thorarchaeota archaeon]